MVEGTENGGSEQGPGSEPELPFESVGGRLRFTVHLRPGETTIVSWKKLLREANLHNSNRPEPGSGSSIDAQCSYISEPRPTPPLVVPCSSKQTTENEPNDSQAQAGPNRLSTVIERIERMYAGDGSSDEEDLALDNVPDDDEYDTEDSFIDDTELDDYFQVDNSAIKHDGFFVNRGKLERDERIISTDQQAKKRRHKDLTQGGESDDGRKPHKIMKVGSKSKKTSSSIQTSPRCQSHKESTPNLRMLVQDTPENAAEVSLKKTADIDVTVDPSELQKNGDAIRQDMDANQHRPGVLQSNNHISKWKESELKDTSAQRSNDKKSRVSKSYSEKHLDNAEVFVLGLPSNNHISKWKESELQDTSAQRSNDKKSHKAALIQRKEGPSVRPKSATLEKAVRELEKIVSEFRPPSTEAQDPDNASQAVKRRLPPEIKQKLAKVARIAQASYGKVPKDMINHLMSIVGHLMHITTLKRNLKAMVNMGLSAKQEKDDRVQKIKQEVAEMVKLRIQHMKSKLEQHNANSDDFQEAGPEEKEALKRKYSMDDLLENKICDLYDLYVEKLEEYSGPPVRRLYEELALLWPDGFMHIDGIKRAIYRAKDRKGLCSHQKDREKIKKKKTLPPKVENTINVTEESHIHEKLSSDSRDRGATFTTNPVPGAAADPVAARPPVSISNRPNQEKPKQTKTKKDSSSSNSTDIILSNMFPKKKVKRKPNTEVVGAHLRLHKLAASLMDKRPSQHKHPASPLSKPKLEPAAP